MEHELLDDSNGCLCEISIAETYQEVALKMGHNLKPLIEILLSELLLRRCICNLNMRLLEYLKSLG